MKGLAQETRGFATLDQGVSFQHGVTIDSLDIDIRKVFVYTFSIRNRTEMYSQNQHLS